MRTLIDIPESDLLRIKKITKNRSEFVRNAVRQTLDAQQAPDIDQFFGIFRGDSEDGLAFQERMRGEWSERELLIDTNILIDFIHGIPEARNELLRYRSRSISAISWMEVLASTPPDREEATRAFLETFLLCPITREVSEQAVAFRRQLRLRLPDAIILATAEVEDLLLVTRNTKDFKPHLPRVRVPYKI